mmetsp:Transcript_2518/g.4843  ORF Transcript_2518/g.4843 Transcript_2518/m.4843 type:complete len:795 (+) Transcript_2518:117-2501(+)
MRISTSTQQLIVFTAFIYRSCHAYYLSLHALEWANASAWCQTFCGSHLASVHSTGDNDALLTLIDRMYPQIYTRAWIGLNDIANSDDWVWSDGSQFDYGNVRDEFNRIIPGLYPWRSNEPDFNKSSDECVAIEVGSLQSGQSQRWVDRRQTSNYHFFCNSCSTRLSKYAAVNVERNQSAAEDICHLLYNTSLASIHSNDDMVEARLTCQQLTEAQGCWIGINDQAVSRQYQWTDGTEWDYGRSFHGYPWYQSAPSTTSLDQKCVFVDPSNSNDPGEYLWDDMWCWSATPKILCNAPSEVCFDDEWFIPTGNPADWQFSKRPCQLSKTVMEAESVAILGQKQFYNSAGMTAEMTFAVHTTGLHASMGMAFYLDENDCDTWMYAGVWIDYSMVFIGKSVNGIWTLHEYASIPTTFNQNTFYRLSVGVQAGSDWTVKINEVTVVTTTDAANAGNLLSGYVGIRNVNATFSVKSLFVSGEVQYTEANNAWYLSCTNAPTLAPTLNPSPAPTETPTLVPTPAPTDATLSPTQSTTSPTAIPTLEPTYTPTADPTADTSAPTSSPTSLPTALPTLVPTPHPSSSPTFLPTEPSQSPTTASPTSAITTTDEEDVNAQDSDNAQAEEEEEVAVALQAQSQTQLIWIVGIPLSLVLMIAFLVYLGRMWYYGVDDGDAYGAVKKKSSHLRSPSNSAVDTNNDEEMNDADKIEFAPAVADHEKGDTEDVQSERGANVNAMEDKPLVVVNTSDLVLVAEPDVEIEVAQSPQHDNGEQTLKEVSPDDDEEEEDVDCDEEAPLKKTEA